MKEPSYTLRFTVDQSPQEVFEAIENVPGWWSETVEGGTRKPGDQFVYRHKDIHYSKQKLLEAIPGKKLVWLVEEADLSFTKARDEWKGTELHFEIAKAGEKTEVRFTHEGLVETFECFDACRKGWTYYVGDSLRALITKGEGKPDKRAARP